MHPFTPLNGNSINYRPGSQIGGPGFNDSSAALMQLTILQMMMTVTAAMLTYMTGQQGSVMSSALPNFGSGGGLGNPGLGGFLGSGGQGANSGSQAFGNGQTQTGKVGSPTGNLVDLGGGKKVDASIAGNVRAMIEAAKRDGVDLKITSAGRSRQEQEVLYQKYLNGTGNLAAKPGTSNHESGLAIDFTNTPGAHAWLAKNAGRFGLKNLPGEPWHYSTTGR
jgi:hypothetical protein